MIQNIWAREFLLPRYVVTLAYTKNFNPEVPVIIFQRVMRVNLIIKQAWKILLSISTIKFVIDKIISKICRPALSKLYHIVSPFADY